MTISKKTEADVLLAIYGSKAFVKIKNRLESMGKILFSFVNISNPKESIDCYLDAEDFCLQISRECSLESGERLIKKIKVEKEKGEQYPKAVWTSPVGGNKTGNKGKPLSRFFSIAPAAKGEVLFEAKSFPATISTTGAFIAEKGAQALATLRVPCTYNDLRKLALKSEYLLDDYFRNKYTVENMKSSYNSNDEEDISDMITMPIERESEENDEMPKSVATATNAKLVTLVARENLVDVKEGVKVCPVIENDKEKRLVCLTSRIEDAEKFGKFVLYLGKQTEAGKIASFKANVIEKDNDLYLVSMP